MKTHSYVGHCSRNPSFTSVVIITRQRQRTRDRRAIRMHIGNDMRTLQGWSAIISRLLAVTGDPYSQESASKCSDVDAGTLTCLIVLPVHIMLGDIECEKPTGEETSGDEESLPRRTNIRNEGCLRIRCTHPSRTSFWFWSCCSSAHFVACLRLRYLMMSACVIRTR